MNIRSPLRPLQLSSKSSFQVSGFRFQVSGFRFQVSALRSQVSGLTLYCVSTPISETRRSVKVPVTVILSLRRPVRTSV